MTELFSKDDKSNFYKLDGHALLTCQKYNLGNESDWFGTFRGGLYGFYARIHGVQIHYDALYNWLPPRSRGPVDSDYHLSSIFFSMDSAIECLTFAMNALGFAAFPDAFKDVTDSRRLREVSPDNVTGRERKALVSGYEKLFPETQKHWQKQQPLLNRIIELHDVSKHRTTIYRGGLFDMNQPPGYFESLGFDPQESGTMLLRPHAEIILQQEPKLARSERRQLSSNPSETLEVLVPRFFAFVRESGVLLLQDAITNLTLANSEFQEPEP